MDYSPGWDPNDFPEENLVDTDSNIHDPDGEWHDEFLQEGKHSYYEEYERFKPPEPEIFLSILDMYRRKGREDIVKGINRSGETKSRVPAHCLPKDPRQKTSKQREENVDKQRTSAKKAYEDYVKYKRQEQNRERIDEFKAMGMFDKKLHHSFALGEDDDKDKLGNQRLSASAGDADQLELDLSKIIGNVNMFQECPVDLVKHKHADRIKSIIKDKYFPGLLDDAINKKVDFYKIAFDVSFGAHSVPPEKMPMETPLSLVEAFDLRVIDEEEELKAMMQASPTRAGRKQAAVKTETEMDGKSFITFFKDHERKGRELVREEEALAQTVELDLAAMARDTPQNEIATAIQCLRRAEIMNEFDKSLQAAEDAYFHAPPELKESAAVHKATTFVTEQLSKKTTTVSTGGTYNPIEVVSYIGITKPAQKYDSDQEDESNQKPLRSTVYRKGGTSRPK